MSTFPAEARWWLGIGVQLSCRYGDAQILISDANLYMNGFTNLIYRNSGN